MMLSQVFGNIRGYQGPARRPLCGARRLAAAAPSRRPAKSTVRASHVTQAVAVGMSQWEKEATELQGKSPLEIMDKALETFGDDIAIAFSGAEDVALVEYAHLTGRKFRVFSLDTGRLNPETYRLFDAVEKRYGIHIEYTFPEAAEVMDLVRSKGMFSFYEDGHQECCRVRKVRPLRRQLGTLKAWITGQRKDQSPGTRTEIPVVQVDPVFEGVEGGAGSLIKYNPLASVTSEEVWNFLRVMDVPVNEMHQNGFISIGCEPCTRPVLPNQHEREGRWWWEDSTKKECGLHAGNVAKGEDGEEVETEGDATSAESKERPFERDLWIGDSKVVKMSKDDVTSLLGQDRDKPTLLVLYAPWCPFCQAMELAFEEVAHTFGDIQVASMRADTEREFAKDKFSLASFPTIVLLPKGTGPHVRFPSERRDPRTLGMWLRIVA